MKETITFGDVLLVPAYSEVISRKQVDLSVDMGKGISLSCPFVSSPMDTVTENVMAASMHNAGGLGVIHRYNTIEEQMHHVLSAMGDVEERSGMNIAAAVGVSGDFTERALELFNIGVKIICVDVAHGHHILMKRALEKLRKLIGDDVHIMAGNVATLEGFNDLADWGADSVRIGIGGGSICSTRIQTGHGVPTLQSVLDCSKTDRDALLIADGGIKNSGDIAKALAAGADLVMCGSMFAGTLESPGEVFKSSDGKKYKVYRGMASVEAQKDWRGKYSSVEGVSTTIPFKGSVKDILELSRSQLSSACSYSGCFNLKSFRNKAKFIKQSSSSKVESSTHILVR